MVKKKKKNPQYQQMNNCENTLSQNIMTLPSLSIQKKKKGAEQKKKKKKGAEHSFLNTVQFNCWYKLILVVI